MGWISIMRLTCVSKREFTANINHGGTNGCRVIDNGSLTKERFLTSKNVPTFYLSQKHSKLYLRDIMELSLNAFICCHPVLQKTALLQTMQRKSVKTLVANLD